ncbi:MAG: hypothetical protein HY709_07615 [Candidatus Latescibacteria bacterium]|nr:hypothetical protein [Candidatus Latescibacterota bacterium]
MANVYWQHVERTYQAYLHPRWNEFLRSYGDAGNPWMAVIHSIRAGMEQGTEEDRHRACRCVDLLMSPSSWDAEKSSWRVGYPPGFGYHPSVDSRCVEGLYYAWKYRQAIGLSEKQTTRIVEILRAKADSAFNREDWFNQENAYWYNNAIYAAYEVTGEEKYADYWVRYLEHFVEYLDKPIHTPWEENFSGYLWPDFSWNYNDRFFDTVEYGLMCYGGMINYQRMKDRGVYSFDEQQLRKVQGYQQYVLGMWQLDGFINWDTGYGPERLLNAEYWAFAQRGLIALIYADSLNTDPEDTSYAKFIFDRGVELFERMDTWQGDPEDGAVPLQPYGVGYAFGSKYETNLMFIANLCIAMDLEVDKVEAKDPGAFWRYNWYHRKLAVSTGHYSTGIVAAGTGNFNYGGLEFTGLFDRWGRNLLTARPSHFPLALTLVIPEEFSMPLRGTTTDENRDAYRGGVGDSAFHIPHSAFSTEMPIHTHNCGAFSLRNGGSSDSSGKPYFEVVESPDGALTNLRPYDIRWFTHTFQRLVARGGLQTENFRYETTFTFLPDRIEIQRKLEVTGSAPPGRILMTIPLSEHVQGVFVVNTTGRVVPVVDLDERRDPVALGDVAYFDFRGEGTGLVIIPTHLKTGSRTGVWLSHEDGDLYSGGPARVVWLCLSGFSCEEEFTPIVFDSVWVPTDGLQETGQEVYTKVKQKGS